MKKFLDFYPKYKDPDFTHRRFKHALVEKKILSLNLAHETIGHSAEGRLIYKISYGSGPIQVLLWSQMHGNEATATMALFDIFNWLQDTRSFDSFKEELKEKCTLHFVPMLNPDGAERFIRTTALGIDMNRDALALQCPESHLLKNLVIQLKPHFCFNLHDQMPQYSAGKTRNQAIISFLATSIDELQTWSPNRITSAQMIARLNQQLQMIVPNHVGRFSDEFEPRAFGDNIQKWGSCLILIESGGNRDDREKMFIRELNFGLLLAAFKSILSEDYKTFELKDYEAIPFNERYLFDLLIQNVTRQSGDFKAKVDIGINFEEKNTPDNTNYQLYAVVEDTGDLSPFYGIKTFDAKGAVLIEDIQPGNQATFSLKHPYKTIKLLNGEILA